MGFERHSIASSKATVRAQKDRPAQQPLALIAVDLTPEDAERACAGPNAMRQARQIRSEWRRRRYTRLTNG